MTAPPETLIERLLLAVVEALKDDDPLLVIGVGENHIEVRWKDEDADQH